MQIDNSNTWETYDDEDKDDLYAAPSAPPPVHVTESYCNISRPLHIDPTLYDEPEPSPTLNRRLKEGRISLNKHMPIHAKTILSYLFKKNNILVIINLLNTLWQKRFIIQKAVTSTVHKGLHTSSKIHHHHAHRSGIAQTMLLLAALNTTSHVLAKKSIHWASKSIHNMGGLDSVLLALSTVALTKSIQRSERIF